MSGFPQDPQVCFGVSKGRGRGLLQAALAHLAAVGRVGFRQSSLVWRDLPSQGVAVQPCTPGEGNQEWASACGSGQAAKAFLSGGGLELKLVSYFLPKHLLSCTLPSPPSLQDFRP